MSSQPKQYHKQRFVEMCNHCASFHRSWDVFRCDHDSDGYYQCVELFENTSPRVDCPYLLEFLMLGEKLKKNPELSIRDLIREQNKNVNENSQQNAGETKETETGSDSSFKF